MLDALQERHPLVEIYSGRHRFGTPFGMLCNIELAAHMGRDSSLVGLRAESSQYLCRDLYSSTNFDHGEQ
jgi:hypothetical protein